MPSWKMHCATQAQKCGQERTSLVRRTSCVLFYFIFFFLKVLVPGSECLEWIANWCHPPHMVQSPIKVLQWGWSFCWAGILGEHGQGVPPPVGVVGTEGQGQWGCVDPARLGTTELGTAWVWLVHHQESTVGTSIHV